MPTRNHWSLFPSNSQADDAIRMILHGGPLKGEAGVISNPNPVPERGGFPGLVIEVDVNDVAKVDAALLPRIDRVWLHDHHKSVRRLPELIWQLPKLRELTLTDSRLNAQLFRRGVPKGVEKLEITGSGRYAPKGPPNPNVRYLGTLIREFHPRLSPEMFPELKGLTIHLGGKSAAKDRREMWEVIGSFTDLSCLHVEPADAELVWSELPSGLSRIKLGNGNLADLSELQNLQGLEFVHLHYLRSMTTLDGIEEFPELRAVVLTGLDRAVDHTSLLRMPKLEYFNGLRSQCPEICAELEARGVTVHA